MKADDYQGDCLKLQDKLEQMKKGAVKRHEELKAAQKEIERLKKKCGEEKERLSDENIRDMVASVFGKEDPSRKSSARRESDNNINNDLRDSISKFILL